MLWPTDILSWETWTLTGTISFLLWYYFHRKFSFLTELNIPHDKPSVLKFGNAGDSFSRAFTYDNEMKKKYGPVWGFYFMTDASITVHDVDMLRQIYVKEFNNFPIRQDRLTKMYGKELGAGITVITGDQWKRVRSSMTPTFSLSKLRKMIPIIDWCTDNTIEVLKGKVKNKEGVFNGKELFSRLSLDVVCSAAFSTKVHSQDDTKEDPPIIVNAKQLFSGSMFGPVFFITFLFPWTENIFAKLGILMMPKKVLEYFRNLFNYIIEQRKTGQHDKSQTDLISLMLESEISEEEAKEGAKKGMTKLEIIGNSMLMILAGYENTGNQMGFLAYNFAMHPEIQALAQEEIDAMMEASETLDSDKVNNLKYLDMCMNESMRLYTPMLRNARICMKETTINGVNFPKGLGVGIPTYALAHDSDYWDEPFEFRPERFEDMSQIDPMMYQPFGAGPRNCIGMRFATLEIKMAFCKILKHYNIRPADGTPEPPLELLFGSSIKPKVDFNLRVVPRENDAIQVSS